MKHDKTSLGPDARKIARVRVMNVVTGEKFAINSESTRGRDSTVRN